MPRVSSARFLGTAASTVGGAIGLIMLSLFAAALITFPAWPTTIAGLTGAGLSATPAVSVNRALKGDRLHINMTPAAAPAPSVPSSPARLPDERRPAQLRTRAHVPLGCDAAFSPISSPLLAHVFRRCVV
jgi:hypothetical protein